MCPRLALLPHTAPLPVPYTAPSWAAPARASPRRHEQWHGTVHRRERGTARRIGIGTRHGLGKASAPARTSASASASAPHAPALASAVVPGARALAPARLSAPERASAPALAGTDIGIRPRAHPASAWMDTGVGNAFRHRSGHEHRRALSRTAEAAHRHRDGSGRDRESGIGTGRTTLPTSDERTAVSTGTTGLPRLNPNMNA